MILIKVCLITTVLLHVTGEPPPQSGNQAAQAGNLQIADSKRVNANIANLPQKPEIQKVEDGIKANNDKPETNVFNAGDINLVKPKGKKRKKKKKPKVLDSNVLSDNVDHIDKKPNVFPSDLKGSAINADSPNIPPAVPQAGSDIKYQPAQVQHDTNQGLNFQKPVVQDNVVQNQFKIPQQNILLNNPVNQNVQQNQDTNVLDNSNAQNNLHNQLSSGNQVQGVQNGQVNNQQLAGVQNGQVNNQQSAGGQVIQQNQQAVGVQVAQNQNNQDVVYQQLNQVASGAQNNQNSPNNQQNQQPAGVQNNQDQAVQHVQNRPNAVVDQQNVNPQMPGFQNGVVNQQSQDSVQTKFQEGESSQNNQQQAGAQQQNVDLPVNSYSNNNDNSVNLNNNNNFNNNNNDMNANQNNNKFNDGGSFQGNSNQGVVRENVQKSRENLRILWDWSDFLINYEQYVMPEQKIRRAPHATTGEPWPLPQYYVARSNKIYRLDKDKFQFRIAKETCDIIVKAVERYKGYIMNDSVMDMYDNFQNAQATPIEDVEQKYEEDTYTKAPLIGSLTIKIRRPCSKYPSDKMDEAYDLFVKRTGAFLWANEVWGALRGLETFSQLVFKGINEELYVKDTVANDYPRFQHRGVLIDTSRHYIFKEVLFDVLEGMAQNKMNVLHWHIVDDQSFPYQSKVYPDLSEKGAFHPSFVYTHEDILEIIEFARYRGIRVMPEFDTPGHTYSWGLSRPDLLTQCYQGARPVNGYLGPLDPSKNETYRFLRNFFNEVIHVFKEQYMHLGGDEVPMTCWSSNPDVLRLLNALDGKPDQPINLQNNDPYMYSYDIRKVLEYYENRLTKDLKDLGRRRLNGVRFVMWQEIMNNNIQLPNDTIIQIWQGDMGDVQRAIDMGYNTLYSTCWYLDLIEYGVKWPKYYTCDPADTSMDTPMGKLCIQYVRCFAFGVKWPKYYTFDPTDISLRYQINEKKVLGGEVCLWAEYIDNENLMSMLWPRGSAAAERLWSSKDVKDVDAAGRRLQEHRCRMLSRGLSIGQISGPDYCLRRGQRRHHASTNCTGGRCSPDTDFVQVERIDLKIKKHGHNDCNQLLITGSGVITLVLICAILIAIGISIKMSGGGARVVQVRFCRNRTIFVVFLTVLFVYFICYTSLWMQVMEFKGTFEKRIRSSEKI